MMAALTPAFVAAGSSVVAERWDGDADWRDFDAAVIGTAWDYQERRDEFLERLSAIAAVTRVYNDPLTVRWNSHKSYLRDLADRGIPVVPTVWLDVADAASIKTAFDRFGVEEIVLKRQVGANAGGQVRLRRGGPLGRHGGPMMAQPFFDAITGEGELSFVFIDGALSHALLKRPAAGDYRVQSDFGGVALPATPGPGDIEAARRVIAAVDADILYARVDMLRGDDGQLRLMELELVEPYLFPEGGGDVGQRLHDALLKRLQARA